MSYYHFCNTFFEWELQQKKSCTIEEGLNAHPLFFQLHYLPLLYANASDCVLLAREPDKFFLESLEDFGFQIPVFQLMGDPVVPNGKLLSYGPAGSVKGWAEKQRFQYEIPALDLVETLTSKVFSFTHSAQLPGSALLQNEENARRFFAEGPFPKVLKTPFGFSGGGHKIYARDDVDYSKLSYPLIAEPWVTRVLDFSTHFVINDQIVCLGQTEMENDAFGRFLSCQTDREIVHKVDHMHLLEQIQKLGFFGPISIDSFLTETEVHPVVEINPRLTMSSIALMIAKKLGGPIRLRYGKEGNFLPSGYRKNLQIVRV